MIRTKFIEINPDDIDKELLKIGAKALKEGGTVAFPTETVYGLGANALDEEAVKKIFEAKGRPSDNPLIVHIAKEDELENLVDEIPPMASILMEKFWPGPLTLVMKKSSAVPDIITAGLDTVAIRMPSHPIAKELIQMAGVPVAAPSANLSGKPSPTKASHVTHDLSGRVDVIISGGNADVGLESTVLDITEDIPMVLRPGGVTLEALQEVLGPVNVDPAIQGSHDGDLKPRSPGMKYTHYAPLAQVIIISGAMEDTIIAISNIKKEKEKIGLKVGIMATDETKDKYGGGVVLSMGSRNQVSTIAANLFGTLRAFDELGVDMVLAEAVEQKLLGQAVMNRMIKAAGYHVVQVGSEID